MCTTWFHNLNLYARDTWQSTTLGMMASMDITNALNYQNLFDFMCAARLLPILSLMFTQQTTRKSLPQVHKPQARGVRGSRGSFGYVPCRRRTSSGAFLPSLPSRPGRPLRMNSDGTPAEGANHTHLGANGSRPSLYDTIIMLKVDKILQLVVISLICFCSRV